MKPVSAPLIALVLGTGLLLAGCKPAEPTAAPEPAPMVAPEPAPAVEAPAPEPAPMEEPAPVEPMLDSTVPDPNAVDPAAAPEAEATEGEEGDAPHSGGDKV